MIAYSNFIKRYEDKFIELGIEHIPSPYIQEHGDYLFPENSLTAETINNIYLIETQGRLNVKRKAEREAEELKRKTEQDKIRVLSTLIEDEVKKIFPMDKLNNEAYETLYPAVVSAAVKDIIDSGTVSLSEDNKLVMGETMTATHPENMNELDRLLYNARISKYTQQEETLEEKIIKAVTGRDAHLFF